MLEPRGNLLAKIAKVGWLLREMPLPERAQPAYFDFCVHAEMVYDGVIYEGLLKFSKDFHAFTGARMAICVTTPLCPAVGEAMAKGGLSQKEFSSRVLRLADFAQIGYHGHFYGRKDGSLVQISRNNYDKSLVTRQIRDEMDWLKGIGITPKIYLAGWWFLRDDMVLELERQGINIDLSVRKGRPDTFGGQYLNGSDIPDYGRPFILPPSKDIVEIQSIFGPVMAPPLMKRHLAPYLERDKDEELFFIFPLHDWDVPRYYRNICANVKELCRTAGTAGWMDVPKMRESYSSRPQAESPGAPQKLKDEGISRGR